MGLRYRFRLLGQAFVLMLLSQPAGIPLIAATADGLGMTLLTMGIPLFVLAVLLTRRLTGPQRWVWCGRTVGFVPTEHANGWRVHRLRSCCRQSSRLVTVPDYVSLC
jgi:hypothetical protein